VARLLLHQLQEDQPELAAVEEAVPSAAPSIKWRGVVSAARSVSGGMAMLIMVTHDFLSLSVWV
jgi:hypothetical protein